MKQTIKQLEKEIEEYKTSGYPNYEYDDDYIKLKTKLQTLKEVCKEIKKMIDNYKELNKKYPKNQTFVDMWSALFLLEQRLQGEQENV